MLLRIALFILMAGGLAGFGAVAWISMQSPSAPVAGKRAEAPVTLHVLTAARTLRPGTLLKPDDLNVTAIAKSAVPEDARLDTPTARAELLGAMIRRTVAAGDVLLPAHVMRAGERGFLAAVLEPGLRAITVGVDAVSGTAGLIWPGDHVDLILTQTLEDTSAPVGRRIAGETVLHNVRVIAIDQELLQGESAGSTPGNASASQTRTVTLEVSPDNAERVAVATRIGHLSLSVIAAEMPAQPLTADAVRAPVTWGGDVSAALQPGRKSDPASGSMHLYEGGSEGKEIRF